MDRSWIVNASPLITLAKIARIPLLLELAPSLIIPKGVETEILRGNFPDAARDWIKAEGAAFVKQIDRVEPLVASWDLGLGESEVLSCAMQTKNSEAILDDSTARKCAKAIGVPTVGTIGIIPI